MSKRPGDPGYAAGWCIHYRSPTIPGNLTAQIATCEAGVEYASVQPKQGPTFRGQPCFLTDKGESKPGSLTCERLRRPTTEEIAAHDNWVEERMQKTLLAIRMSSEFRKANKGKSASTVIDCPACKTGKLSMTIAACNGHVHGRCSTDGCVSWME